MSIYIRNSAITDVTACKQHTEIPAGEFKPRTCIKHIAT